MIFNDDSGLERIFLLMLALKPSIVYQSISFPQKDPTYTAPIRLIVPYPLPFTIYMGQLCKKGQ